jgi:AcrR family transcriptional regulator
MGRRPLVTREQVLRAARDVFSERGFDGTTLSHISARLGISPAALLRHAPTKEALFGLAFAEEAPEQPHPMEFLNECDGTEDPRKVLRKLANKFLPFLESKMGETIARWMKASTEREARTVILPFDPRKPGTPPQRALAMLEGYIRRAKRHGRMRVKDPRAAALAFIGAVHSYLFLHRVVRITHPPHPFSRYLGQLLDIWTKGAIR